MFLVVDRMFPDYPEEDHRHSDMPLMKWGEPFPDDASEATASVCTTNSICSRIPATVTNDEFSMLEGAAICMYLADLYGRFLPEPQYKSEYYRWVKY